MSSYKDFHSFLPELILACWIITMLCGTSTVHITVAFLTIALPAMMLSVRPELDDIHGQRVVLFCTIQWFGSSTYFLAI